MLSDATARRRKCIETLKRTSLEGHKGGVTSVALSADGERVVSGSQDKTIKIWSAETGASERLSLSARPARARAANGGR